MTKGNGVLPRVRILVVDDEKAIGESIELAISLTENETVYFSNPVQAVEEIRANKDHYHAIFTDLRMPEMNGEEVISKVRKIAPDMPIVVITASRGIFTTDDMVKLNIISLIAKPFELTDIELAVKLVQEKYHT